MKTIPYGESKWKLVPVEPTPEMVSAAEEAHMPFGDMDIALRMAILSAAPAQATDGLRIGAWRDALEKIAKYAPPVNCAARTEFERIGLIAVHALIAFSAPQFSQPPAHQEANNAAAPIRPATGQGDGWIPVSERLPQIKQVLSEKCTLEGREIPTLYRSGMVLTFDGSRVSAGIVEWFHSKSPLNNVTHWMPLPESPAIAAARQEGGKV